MDNGHPKRRVLVVDDDSKILRVDQELLSQHGFTVTTCPDSAQVVPLLKANCFDVMLLDIRMPGLEGTDLLPLVKRLHPDLPVLLVSAYCEDTDAAYYQRLGASGIIRKPYSHEGLLDAIARAIDQEEYIPLLLTSSSLHEGRDLVYRKLMLAALRKTDWNQVEAAKRLGVSRYCLIRWMKKLGITS